MICCKRCRHRDCSESDVQNADDHKLIRDREIVAGVYCLLCNDCQCYLKALALCLPEMSAHTIAIERYNSMRNGMPSLPAIYCPQHVLSMNRYSSELSDLSLAVDRALSKLTLAILKLTDDHQGEERFD